MIGNFLDEREIEFFIIADVDSNKDGNITKEEANQWPEFHWLWRPDQKQISIQEIETALRGDLRRTIFYENTKNNPLYGKGVFNRGPLYALTASLNICIYVFTGELDLQTPARGAQNLQKACDAIGKTNCQITIVPGLGHGFSEPKSPRKHPLLDLTLGPVDSRFQETLFNLAKSLSR